MHKMGALIFSRQVVFAICNQWTEQQIELFESFIIWFPGTNWETINFTESKLGKQENFIYKSRVCFCFFLLSHGGIKSQF